MTALRRWLHNHGWHRFCHIARVVERYVDVREYLTSPDGDDVDVTNHAGTPIYRLVHR